MRLGGIAGILALLWGASGAMAQGDRSVLYGERPDLLKGAEVRTVGYSAEEAVTGGAERARSPQRSFLLSLIVPGIGELYGGATKRGIGFLAVEAGLWTFWVRDRGKGKDVEKDFRAFADDHWSLADYLRWRTSDFTYADTTHALPFKDEEERQQSQGQPGRGPEVDRQQYYELVGKYDQFIFGWDDRTSDDITDSTYTVVSERRLKYEDMRDKSNDHLKRASQLAGIILVNHIVSAIDAAVYAKKSGGGRANADRRLRVQAVLAQEADGRGAFPMMMVWRRF